MNRKTGQQQEPGNQKKQEPTNQDVLSELYGKEPKELEEKHLQPRTGGFKLVRDLLGEEGHEKVEKYLRPYGVNINGVSFKLKRSMGYYYDPEKHEKLSKSEKVVNSIDVYRKGEERKDPLLRMYVKYTENERENEIARLAAERGWSGEIFNEQKMDGGGFIVEERHKQGTSIRKMGRSLSREEAIAFGRSMGRKVKDMVSENLIFDFKDVGPTNVRIVERENARDPFEFGEDDKQLYNLRDLHRAINKAKPEEIRHHVENGNDFANWVRDSMGNEELAGEIRELNYREGREDDYAQNLQRILAMNMYDVKFIGADHYVKAGEKNRENTVEQLENLARLFDNIGSRFKAQAYTEFKKEFMGEKPSSIWESVLKKIRMSGYEQRENYLEDTRERLTETNPDSVSQAHWEPFFQSVDEIEHGETRKGVTITEEEDVDVLASELEQKGVKRAIGKLIAEDLIKDRGFKSENIRTFDSHEEEDKIILRPIDAQGKQITEYTSKRLKQKGDVDKYKLASNSELSPEVHFQEGEIQVAYESKGKRLSDAKNDMDEHKSVRFGKSLADDIASGFRSGLLPSKLRTQDIRVDESFKEVLFTNWDDIEPKDQLLELNEEKMVEYLSRNMDVIRETLHPALVWRTFKNQFGTVGAADTKEANRNKRIFNKVEKRLRREDSEWDDIINESERSLIVKKEFRETQKKWLKTLRDKDTVTRYHKDTLDKLKDREDVLAEGINKLVKQELFSDLIADVRHLHVMVPGDEDTVLDAKTGNIDLEEGGILFEKYLHNEDRPRTLLSRFIVPFNGDEVGEPQELSEEGMNDLRETHVSQAAFKVHLSPDEEGKHHAGGERYSFQWRENYFTDEDETINKVRKAVGSKSVRELSKKEKKKLPLDDLREEVAVEDEWEKALNVIVESYSNWREVIKKLLEVRDNQDTAEDEKAFILRGKRGKGLSDLLNPSDPEFLFDGRFKGQGFENYRDFPELLDKKVDTAYPKLDDRVTRLLTLEKARKYVLERERETGGRLTEQEQVKLLEELEEKGDIKPVKLKGGKPSEYIKDIKYRQDGSHYVTQITVNTENQGKKDVILKRDDLAKEILPSTVLMHASGEHMPDMATPMVVALDNEYGVETLRPGKMLARTDDEVLQRHWRKIAKTLGTYARASNICGDCHSRNVLINESEDGRDCEITRIDLERSRKSDKTLEESIMNFELNILTSLPGWEDNKLDYWNSFKEGILDADRRLKEPQAQEDIRKMLQMLYLNYPEKRTGINSTFKENIEETLDMDGEEVIDNVANRQLRELEDAQKKFEGTKGEFNRQRRRQINFWRGIAR